MRGKNYECKSLPSMSKFQTFLPVKTDRLNRFFIEDFVWVWNTPNNRFGRISYDSEWKYRTNSCVVQDCLCSKPNSAAYSMCLISRIDPILSLRVTAYSAKSSTNICELCFISSPFRVPLRPGQNIVSQWYPGLSW